ncbi:MAG: FAD:protein FMN transferase [Aeoliella sp.]
MANQSSSTRRDFLSGKAAGQAAANAVERAADKVAGLADDLFPEQQPSKPLPPSYVLTLQRQAMACDFEIRINARREQENSETAAAMMALDLVDQLESQLTVYRDTSEIIEINRRAADELANQWIEVEPQLFKLLEYADQLYRDTEGAFDLTGGPLAKVWGFFYRQGRMPTEEEISTARKQIGWEKVGLDSSTQRIRFDGPGVEINVNSLGKGYALDRAAAVLQQNGVENFLFHGGRSTLLARGNRAGEQGWTAGLRHPLRPKERLAQFQLQNEALSTSGSATQSFRYRDKRYGHLIDPRTGWPTEGIYSATVIAPSATEADALSTALYVMGAAAAEEFCGSRPEIKALLVLPTECEGKVDVRRINL